MTEFSLPESVQFSIDWSMANHMPAQAPNQFATMLGIPDASGEPEGAYLLIGSVNPPVFLGQDAAVVQQQLAAAGNVLPVQIQGNFRLSRQRLGELIGLLQQAADQYDAAVEQVKAAQQHA